VTRQTTVGKNKQTQGGKYYHNKNRRRKQYRGHRYEDRVKTQKPGEALMEHSDTVQLRNTLEKSQQTGTGINRKESDSKQKTSDTGPLI